MMTSPTQNKIVYTAIFFSTSEVVAKYPQTKENLFSHHSTIQFRPDGLGDLEIGKKITVNIKGRLTTDKVDVLVVDNPLSKNKFPHITLSTAEGVKPFESNSELETHSDKIVPLNDSIQGIIGYFDGVNEVTRTKELHEQIERMKELLRP